MPRRGNDDYYDRAYWNHMDAMEENEEMRIEYIKKNPTYKTRKEYEEALESLDKDIQDYYDHIFGNNCPSGLELECILDRRDALEMAYNTLKEEFDLIYSEDEK